MRAFFVIRARAARGPESITFVTVIFSDSGSMDCQSAPEGALRDDEQNMQWTDDGIVLGVKRHGEANAILELMTHGHGRHLGLVRGGFGSRLRPVLQPGNSVSASWRARLDEHLGNYTVEGLRLRAASYFSAPHAIYGVTHLAALMRLLPERDPHTGLYEVLDANSGSAR